MGGSGNWGQGKRGPLEDQGGSQALQEGWGPTPLLY